MAFFFWRPSKCVEKILRMKTYQWNKMTNSEIYKILWFEKTKLITTTKLLCPQKRI